MNVPLPVLPLRQPRHLAAFLVRLGLGAIALIVASSLIAADPIPKQPFDLPADVAETSLKLFAAQCRLEVLFSPESTASVRTNAIKGDFTPRDAMDRLLAGTSLVAAQDSKTGAFSVSRSPAPPSLPVHQKKKLA